jgi:hypothetical protein
MVPATAPGLALPSSRVATQNGCRDTYRRPLCEAAEDGSEQMWMVECPRCQRRRLYGADRVRAVWNVASGLIAVQLACTCGEVVSLLTGRRLSEPDDRLPAGHS